MTQLGSGLRLAQESRPDFSTEGQFRRQDLDGDQTLEAAVAGLVNDTHAATTDLAVELVRRREDSLDVCSRSGSVGGPTGSGTRVDWLGTTTGQSSSVAPIC